MILVTLLSLLGNLVESVILSVIAVVCLNYYFVEPLHSLRMTHPVDVVALAAFMTTSTLIPGLSIRMRRVAAEKLEQTRADLARFARVASLGELTATIAHEVNQPLAGVVSSGNACQRWLASDPPNLERAIQSVDRLIRDANRASQVIERVRDLARNSPPKKVPLSINHAVLEIMILVRGESEKQGILLETQLTNDLPLVLADRIQLQQVGLNLVNNAIEALSDVTDRPRNLFVRTEKNEGNELLLTVRDSGKGIDPLNAQRVFDSFYTTKPEGMGMGLVKASRLSAKGPMPQGSVTIIHLDEEPRFNLLSSFDSLLFYIPEIALDELTDSSDASRIAGLSFQFATLDPMLHQLGRALLPALENAQPSAKLFFDHLALAMFSHLATVYGEIEG